MYRDGLKAEILAANWPHPNRDSAAKKCNSFQAIQNERAQAQKEREASPASFMFHYHLWIGFFGVGFLFLRGCFAEFCQILPNMPNIA